MVPREAAREALGASPAEIIPLIERYRDPADTEGLYLSPSAPGVAVHLEQVVSELVRRYPVNGLHLDFVRYPSSDYDWSRAALEGFGATRGGGDLLAAPALDPEGWADYRRAALDGLTVRLSAVARQTRPGLVVSAAVVADLSKALDQNYQPWPSWMARGVLDAVCPMTYTPDTKLFRAQVEQARGKLGAAASLWAGVGAWRLPLGSVIEKIRAAREAGASGVVLFSHESFGAADLDRLRADAFPTPGGGGARGGASRGGGRTDEARPGRPRRPGHARGGAGLRAGRRGREARGGLARLGASHAGAPHPPRESRADDRGARVRSLPAPPFGRLPEAPRPGAPPRRSAASSSSSRRWDRSPRRSMPCSRPPTCRCSSPRTWSAG